jgi:SAM-dependent methyltransferase
MDKNYEVLYHDSEEVNWWFVSRRDMIIKILKNNKVPLNAKILDIGCAGGTLLVEMKDKGYTNLYGLDYSAEAIAVCKNKGIENLVVMDGHSPEFAENSFDVIIASDTLEHLENDEVALKNWNKLLKGKGLCLVFVPAYNHLWSEHDVVNYHFRRYTLTNLITKSQNAGFKICSSGYWNVLIYIPALFFRLFSKLRSKREIEDIKGDIISLPAVINNLLISWMKFENIFSSKLRLPFGVSTFVIMTK